MKTVSVEMIYIMAVIAGALGGAATGSHVFLSKRGFRAAFALAYIIIGMAVAFGLTGYLLWTTAAPIQGLDDPALHRLLFTALAGGLFGSLGLSGIHLLSKMVLKYKGIEVQITTRPPEDKKDG